MHIDVHHLPDTPGSVVLADMIHDGQTGRRTLVREINGVHNLHWYAHMPVADGSWASDDMLSDVELIFDAGDSDGHTTKPSLPSDYVIALRGEIRDRMREVVGIELVRVTPWTLVDFLLAVVDNQEIQALRSCNDEVTVQYGIELYDTQSGDSHSVMPSPSLVLARAYATTARHAAMPGTAIRVIYQTTIQSVWNPVERNES